MNVKLVMAKGDAQGHTIHLREDRTVVGRTRDCKVRIPSADVSRRHCILTFEEGYLHVEDLGSTNGTFINGERIADKQIVHPGDLLEVGPVTFAVHYESPEGGVEVLPVVEDLEALEHLVGEKTTELDAQRGKRTVKHEDALSLDGVEVIEEVAAGDEIADVEVVEDAQEAVDIGFDVDEDSLHLPNSADLRDILSGLDGNQEK